VEVEDDLILILVIEVDGGRGVADLLSDIAEGG